MFQKLLINTDLKYFLCFFSVCQVPGRSINPAVATVYPETDASDGESNKPDHIRRKRAAVLSCLSQTGRNWEIELMWNVNSSKFPCE